MADLHALSDTQDSTKALLQLCKRLERAWNLPDILAALVPVVDQVLGYPHAWLGLLADRPGFVTIISQGTTQPGFDQLHAEVESLEIPVAGDPMLEELLKADHVVVVVDARTDPRTNKAVVEQLQNRTIINVPLLLADECLGALGMGTYGDVEGVRPPSDWQVEFMQTLAGHVAVALDRVRFIQTRKRIEDALYQEKERLQVTLHSISDAVITTNATGELQYINPVAQSLTGWELAAAVGRPYQAVFVFEADGATDGSDMVAQAMATAQTLHYPQLRLFHRAHGHCLVEAAVSPIRDADGDVQGAVLVFRDVTEQRRLSQEVAFQATHDELTGLGNRRAFEQALAHCFDQVRTQPSHRHVVCYLDLDEFKVVNDTCGHTAGDELLRQVAQLFRQELHSQDHFCRIGGDEFGMVLLDLSVEQALRVAERLQHRLSTYRFAWRDQNFGVGVSIGMVALDVGSESVGALLQAADSACYVAKDAGRGRIHVYASDDPALAQRYGVMEWVSRIERALQQDRFVLYAQPIVPVHPQSAAGLHCEFLLRMHDDAGNVVMPGQFMPAVERYHLAHRVDRWVFNHALQWMEAHHEVMELGAINLSGQSLGDDMFMTHVLDTLAHTRLPCHKLCFEITETAAIGNLHTAQRFIATLRGLGCKLSLDDFGSGLSSFAYLRTLPVDVLKIDGQFVRDIATDAVSLAMVRSIHEIGCLMGKATVAEFVESPAILALLQGLDVHYAQGYAVGHPMPLDQLLVWHTARGTGVSPAANAGV